MSINSTVVKQFFFTLLESGKEKEEVMVRATSLKKARTLLRKKYKGTPYTFKPKN